MSAGSWLPILILVAGAAAGVFYYRRARAKKEKARLKGRALPPKNVFWGKQFVAPKTGFVCEAAKMHADRCFKFDEAPAIPLPECTCKLDCRCTYLKLKERRSGNDRRSGRDRRPAIRYDPDKPPRRSGRDRRKDKDTPFNDYVI